MDVQSDLARARGACERRAWLDGYEALRVLDANGHLGVGDLERLALAAYLTGHESDAFDVMERVHHLHLGAGAQGVAPAARWAIWLGILHALAGNHAQGGGWLARAERILDEADLDGPERGFLLVPAGLQALDRGDPEAADDVFAQVSDTGRRFSDADLLVMGLLGRGQASVAAGDMRQGAAQLDEAMVAVTTGDVIPLIAGIAYCAVIIACRDAFDRRRAQEWTAALSRWCDQQQGLHPYRGQCLVHRSEIMQFHGEWTDALAEIRQACEHLSRHRGDPVMGMARYQEAELLRLCGELEAAEAAYREASAWGHSPQPGLALLRLAQGRSDEAVAAVNRVFEQHPLTGANAAVRRAGVLAAAIEIGLAVGDLATAERATAELEQVAANFGSDYLRASARSARGEVALAGGDPATANAVLREALQDWQRLDAPYEAARVRTAMARACQSIGDLDTAGLEFEAARSTFEQLGAAPDVTALDAMRQPVEGGGPEAPGGLTPREVEVLQLVATGASNREVAVTLVISERTVARHLSNLFTKLGVSTRSAATAWAYEHGLR
jgi:ATP/maltotriose-dependent transcriptional regulator MalT